MRHSLTISVCCLWIGCLVGQPVYAQSRAGGTDQPQSLTPQQQRQVIQQQFAVAVVLGQLNIATVYYANKRYDQAQAYLQRVLRVAPTLAAAHMTLGLIYYELDQPDLALESFRKASGDNAPDSLTRANLDVIYTNAHQQYQKIFSEIPPIAEVHAKLGNLLEDGNLLEEAIKEYQKALAADSTYAPAYVNLGMVYNAQGRFDEALKLFERALALQPDLAPAYLNQGSSYIGKERLNEAITCWQKALEINPQYPQAHFNLGMAYRQQRNLVAAIQEWQLAIAADSTFLPGYSSLIKIYFETGDVARAIPLLQHLIALNQGTPDVHLQLAMAYEAEEQFAEALQEYQRLAALDPDNPSIQASLEIVKNKQQQRNKARSQGKIRVRHILLDSRAKAEQVLQELQQGADFATLARKHSLDATASRGGDLGYIGKGEMLPAFEKAAMALKIGQVSGIVKTSRGYHIIKRIE